MDFRSIETHPNGLREKKRDVPWPKMSPDEYMEGTIWIDESGMGCLAGPVHVGGTFILPSFDLLGVHDSKLLNERERDRIRSEVECSDKIIVHVESVTAAELDELGGLGKAWRVGISRTVDALIKKVAEKFPHIKLVRVVLDGNKSTTCALPVITSTKADQKFVGVSIAAIFAKTSRDAFMIEAAKLYPEFEEIFRKGKGYYHSKAHVELIERGIYTDLHRKTYSDLKGYLDRQNKVVTPRMSIKDE